MQPGPITHRFSRSYRTLMRLHVTLQTVKRCERSLAVVVCAHVGTFTGMGALVSFQMMRSRERFATTILSAPFEIKQ